MNRYEIRQTKRGKWFVKLNVGGKTFVQTIPFYDTRAEAEAKAEETNNPFFDASLTYGG